MRITAVTTSVPSMRKPRLLSFAQALVAAGHEVSVVAASDLSQGGRGGGSSSDIAALESMGMTVVEVPFEPGAAHLVRATGRVALRRSSSESALYASRALARRVSAAVIAARPDVVHVDRVRAYGLVRELGLPTVVDLTDPRQGTYRLYRDSGNLSPRRVGIPETLRAWLDRGPARREEIGGLRGVPVLVASRMARDALVAGGAEARLVWDLPNVVLPQERAEPVAAGTGAGTTVGMSGNLSYPPNVLGFETLAREIVPALRQRLDARVVVVGSRPHPLLLRRAAEVDAEVHRDVASVPAAIRELGVAAMLSPQRVSAGFPNRVVDAAYRAGTPIVVSPETARATPEAIAAALPTAASPGEWVDEVQRMADPGERRTTVSRLQEAIDRACGPAAVAAKLTAAYEQAVGA